MKILLDKLFNPIAFILEFLSAVYILSLGIEKIPYSVSCTPGFNAPCAN
jgi:hypothetical protein